MTMTIGYPPFFRCKQHQLYPARHAVRHSINDTLAISVNDLQYVLQQRRNGACAGHVVDNWLVIAQGYRVTIYFIETKAAIRLPYFGHSL
jgi:predicted RNA-binding protein associated with RNAse of E/G family